jgi:urease accessory protein UreE
MMLTLNTRIEHADRIDGELVLTHDQREKTRLRAALASGEEVALFMVRGTVLRHGDLLRGDDGRWHAAPTTSATATPRPRSARTGCASASTRCCGRW